MFRIATRTVHAGLLCAGFGLALAADATQAACGAVSALERRTR